ncbi:MAG TPA: phosphotransferase [Acidimicrobiia bacterium]|nr:phosphotransferase [Acidimicrobiia bacterium]
MSVTNPATSALRDERLPELETLLAAGIPEPLKAAMAASRVTVEAAEAVQVTHWPGRSVTVRYKAELAGPGVQGSHQLVAIGGKVPDGAAVVASGSHRIGIWRVPFDPFLPGLSAALNPPAAAALMAQLGVQGDGWATRLVAYRPGKRAVVHVAGAAGQVAGTVSQIAGSVGTGSVYLKLLPTDQIERLHVEHRKIARELPIPQSLGVSHELGLVALQTLPGMTLREALVKGLEAPLPEAVLSLPAALPDPPFGQLVASPIQRAASVAGILGFLLPERSQQVASIIDRIGQESGEASVPVHGDFYESQVLVDGGRIVGMLDIDTFGWGRPADDPATLLGHLAVLDQSKPSTSVRSFASRLVQLCDRNLDPIDLRMRVAAVVLGLATGPFRVQRANWPEMTRARLDLAGRWCASAARVAGTRDPGSGVSGDERTLISVSGPSHGAQSSF